MNSEYEDDKLDETLRKAMGSQAAEFDVEAWMKAHPEAADAFCRSTASVDPTPTVETESIQFKGSDRPRRSIYKRIMNTKSFKIGVPAALAAMVIVMMMVWTIGGNPKVAFADALKQLQGKSYEFVIHFQEDSKLSLKGAVLEPGRIRCDHDDPSYPIAIILDNNARQSLVLWKNLKIAQRLDNPNNQKEAMDVMGFLITPGRSISDLWSLQTGTETKLAPRKINGIDAQGFEVKRISDDYSQTITVWADAKTAAPIQVEIVVKSDKEDESPGKITLSGFKVNEKPDRSLFSTEIPEGYEMANLQTLKQIAGKATTRESKGKTSEQAGKILGAMKSWLAGDKSQAVETFMTVDWNAEIRFGMEYPVFALTESQFLSLVVEDQKKVMESLMEQIGGLRDLSKELLNRAKKARAAQDYDQAEKYLNAIDQLGRAMSGDKNRMNVVRMTGAPIRKMAAAEKVMLYEDQGLADKLQEAQKQAKAIDDEIEAMRKAATGK